MREDINLNHLIEWKLNLLSEISTIIFNPLEEETSDRSDRSVLSAASHVMILSLTLSDIKNAAIQFTDSCACCIYDFRFECEEKIYLILPNLSRLTDLNIKISSRVLYF